MRHALRHRVPTRHVRWLARGWLASATALLGILGGVTAQAAWPATATSRQPLPAALRWSAPAATTTAAAYQPVRSDVVARPFSLGDAAPGDRARAVGCLAAAVYYEAASESVAGQQAVAQVVLNRVRHPAFPHSVCGVVYQRSARGGCQFSFACDGATARAPGGAAWARAVSIAGAALAGQVFAPVGLATHYHSRAVRPDWSRTLMLTDAIGAHLFHRWRGAWGMPAAFAARYAGAEPMAGLAIAYAASPSRPMARGDSDASLPPDQLDDGPIPAAIIGPGAADDAAPEPIVSG